MSGRSDECDKELQLAFHRSLEPAGATASLEPAGATASLEPAGATASLEPAGATASLEPAGATASLGPAGATAGSAAASGAGVAVKGSASLAGAGWPDAAERTGSGPGPAAKRSKSEEDFSAEAGGAKQSVAHRNTPGALTMPEDEAAKERRLQREIRAAAAERRMRSTHLGAQGSSSSSASPSGLSGPATLPEAKGDEAMRESLEQQGRSALGLGGSQPQGQGSALEAGQEQAGGTHQSASSAGSGSGPSSSQAVSHEDAVCTDNENGTRISLDQAIQLFDIVFGANPPAQTLSQWTNQGFRFSDDPETSLGLVQREGGPCGVLAPVQALLLKYLLFPGEAAPGGAPGGLGTPALPSVVVPNGHAADTIVSRERLQFSEEERKRALVSAMAETLWVAGEGHRAVLAIVDAVALPTLQPGAGAASPEGVALTSPARLQQGLHLVGFSSWPALAQGLCDALPVFESGIGALLMLLSAILSRTLAKTQADRDDPEPPLVTRPFGHASQEIVNLLLSGRAVPNVFDGVMDLGEGMALKGIPGLVEVGFLTLLEALNLCKVGEHLKCPRLPIWVVGSESHYTVLFALDRGVQEEGDQVDREERRVRHAFDSLDTSGGGGFITPEALDQLGTQLGFQLPAGVKEEVGGGMGVVVWQELWKALLRLEPEKGGFKHLADAAAGTAQGPKRFSLFHFNGIAKRVLTPTQGAAGGAHIYERPRLMELWVSVPPKWTPDECMAIQPYTGLSLGPTDMDSTIASGAANNLLEDVTESTTQSMFDRVQHAPLADCIRTRWSRATCGWDGDAPSIV